MTHKRKHLLSSPEDHDTTGLVPGQLLEGSGDRIASSGVFSADVADAVALKHQQNTDQYLDQGGPNQVAASEIRSHLDSFGRKSVVVISSAGTYTASINDDVIVYTSNTGLLTVTLPSPAGNTGKTYTIVGRGANNALPSSKPKIHITAAGGATIGGGLTYKMLCPSSVVLVSDGTTWAVESHLTGYGEKEQSYQSVDATASPYIPEGSEEIIVAFGSAPVTVDLSSAPKDWTAAYWFLNVGSADLTLVDTYGAIDGSSTLVLRPQEAALVVYGLNASTWRVLVHRELVRERTVTYTAGTTLTLEERIVFANSTAAITLTLPASPNLGHTVRIKNINTGSVTVAGGGATIDGAASFSLPNQYDAADFVWNGTEWSVF